MSDFPLNSLGARLQPIDLDAFSTHHVVDWRKMSEPERLKFMRNVILTSGRDPRLAKLSVSIFRKAGVQPRDYKGQAASLLKWVQDPKNIFYVNESAERLQTAQVSLRLKLGDCDDQVILLCSLFESVRLPWKLVIAGTQGKGPNIKKVRFIEGGVYPQGCTWNHIYCLVGTPPFRPVTWYFCETTIQGVPLGWDIINGDKGYLPEMDISMKGPTRIVPAPKVPFGFRPKPLPKPENRSPAYAAAYGQFTPSPASAGYGAVSALSPIGAAVGASIADDFDDQALALGEKRKILDWEKMLPGIVTAVAVSVGAQLLLDWIRPILSPKSQA